MSKGPRLMVFFWLKRRGGLITFFGAGSDIRMNFLESMVFYLSIYLAWLHDWDFFFCVYFADSEC